MSDAARRIDAIGSAAVALYGHAGRRSPERHEPSPVETDFGPFDLEDALRFEAERRERSLFLGDLIGVALVTGAAVWSVAASLA